MVRPDILMQEDRITLVGDDGPEQVNGTEKGDFEIASDVDVAPSFKMNADRANLIVGGGDGNAPEGDLRLRDRNGIPRVQFTAESGNRVTPTENRVWIDGARGLLELGFGEDGNQDPSIRLDASDAELEEPAESRIGLFAHYQGSETAAANVSADARGIDLEDTSAVRVGNTSADGLLTVYWDGLPGAFLGQGQLYLGNAEEAGRIGLGEGMNDPTIDVDGGRGRIDVGGDVQGDVLVRDDSDRVSAELRGDGEVTAGGSHVEGAVHLRHPAGTDGETVDYRIKAREADGDVPEGLVFEVQSGSGDSFTEAMRIERDGTVRVDGGSVQPL